MFHFSLCPFVFFKFYAKKTSISKCSSVSLERLGLQIFPDVLKIRSDQWRLVVFKVREEGLRAWLPLACFTVSGVWWNTLFQGELQSSREG